MPLDYSIGDLRFRADDGVVRGSGADAHLTPIESSILAVFCERSKEVLSVGQIVEAVWPGRSVEGSRARLDTHLTNLRAKLRRHAPELIRNVRGRGFRLDIPAERVESVFPGAPLQVAHEILSGPEFMARLLPVEAGGALQPYSQLVVQSPRPLEILPEYDGRVVENIISAGVSYTFLMPATAVDVAASLINTIVVSSRRRSSAGTFDWSTLEAVLPNLGECVRIVLAPYSSVDSVYIINATDEHSAALFYYLSQEQSAIYLKVREAARSHASELLKAVPEQAGPVVQFGSGVLDRSGIAKRLRIQLLRRLGTEGEDLIAHFVPEDRQNLKVVPAW